MRGLDCQIEYWNDVGPTKTFAHPPNLERLARSSRSRESHPRLRLRLRPRSGRPRRAGLRRPDRRRSGAGDDRRGAQPAPEHRAPSPHRSSRPSACRRIGRRGASLRRAHLHTDRPRPARRDLGSEPGPAPRRAAQRQRPLDADRPAQPRPLRPRSREIRNPRGVRAPRRRRAAASGAWVVRDAHRGLRDLGARPHGARDHERSSGERLPVVRPEVGGDRPRAGVQ